MLNCYIDEAGDEGIGRGTRWFILAGLIVEKNDDRKVSQVIYRINKGIGRPPGTPFHWREHKRYVSRKRLACLELSKEPITLAYVAVDTTQLDPRNFSFGGHQVYRYFCRFLLERITWFARDRGQKVDIIFSNRASFSYQELISYIRHLRFVPGCQIDHEVISSISAHPMQQVRLLQAADIAAGALFDALEPDSLGFTDERHILTLMDKLYRRGGKLFSYGLKPFGVDVSEFIKEYSWLKQLA